VGGTPTPTPYLRCPPAPGLSGPGHKLLREPLESAHALKLQLLFCFMLGFYIKRFLKKIQALKVNLKTVVLVLSVALTWL